MTAIDISVRGGHTVTVAPERGTVHAAVGLEGAEPEPVFRAVSAALADITASLEALHHPKRGPVTWYAVDQVRMGSRRPWNSDGAQLPLVHSAAVTMAVTFRDFDELARWVAWSVGVEGLSIGSVEWDLTAGTRAEIERKTRQKAVKDAQRRAQDYADALELGTVAVRRISDPGTGASTPMARAALAPQNVAVDGAAPEFALRPEDVAISAAVEAVFTVSGGK